MDSSRFDRLVKAAAHSLLRRDAVRLLVGGALAVGGTGLLGAEAKQKPKTCQPGTEFCDHQNWAEARCGKKKGCYCATGTEGVTICGSVKNGLCSNDGDLCQQDSDCDAITGPGSVCDHGPRCGCPDVPDLKGCTPPCGAKKKSGGRAASGSPRQRLR